MDAKGPSGKTSMFLTFGFGDTPLLSASFSYSVSFFLFSLTAVRFAGAKLKSSRFDEIEIVTLLGICACNVSALLQLERSGY